MASGCWSCSRRSFLSLSAAAAGSALVLRPEAASAALAPTRTIALHTQWSDERFVGPYLEGGSYLSSALRDIDHLLRDRHNQSEHPIDVRLLDLLHAFKKQAGYHGSFEVACGYRSAETNRMLRRHGVHAAKDSLHIQGQAVDVRFDGLSLRKAHQIALDMRLGGVGFYPHGNFLHLDVGPVRAW